MKLTSLFSSFFALCLAGCFVLTGCGDDHAETAASGTESTTETTTESTEDPVTGVAIPKGNDGSAAAASSDSRDVKALDEWTGGADRVYDEAEFDFNGDGTPDRIVILKAEDEGGEYPSDSDRKLLILEGNSGGYKLSDESTTAVMCEGCGGMMGDPVQPLSMEGAKAGQFTLSHAGGSRERWAYDHTYAYNTKDGKWYLVSKKTTVMDTMTDDGSGDTEEEETYPLMQVPLSEVTF